MEESPKLFTINILDKSQPFSCRLAINPHHPVFKGHFPERPIMPGAWLVRAIHDIIEQITGEKLILSEARQVKFLAPLLPDNNPEVMVEGKIYSERTDQWLVDAQVRVHDKVIVKFSGTFIIS